MISRFIVDVLNEESIDELTEWLKANNYIMKGMAYTVGKAVTLPYQAMKSRDFSDLFTLNASAFAILFTHLYNSEFFNRDDASVVVISSIVSQVGARGKIGYSTSKGSLNAIVRSLALEVASKKIRVNAISPGTVYTEMLDRLINTIGTEGIEKLKDEYPLGIGYPEDIADLAYFLLTPASRWMSGNIITIDGGYSAR